MCSSPRTAHGTPVQFQGTNKPLYVWLHVMTGSTKANWCDSYEKHPANLREQPHGRSCKSAKHPTQTMWEACGCAQGEKRCTNVKLRKTKWSWKYLSNRVCLRATFLKNYENWTIPTENTAANQETITSSQKQAWQYYTRAFSQEQESSQAFNKSWYFLSSETSKNW